MSAICAHKNCIAVSTNSGTFSRCPYNKSPIALLFGGPLILGNTHILDIWCLKWNAISLRWGPDMVYVVELILDLVVVFLGAWWRTGL